MAQPKSRLARIGTFILFGFLVLSFALWGIGDIFRGGSHSQVVATVGKQDISRAAFEQSLDREVRAAQQNMGGQLTAEQLVQLGVPQRALAPLIDQALLTQLAEDRGLVVTEAQLLEQVRHAPAFQVNGAFSPDAYRVWLRNANLTEGQFLAMLSLDVVRENTYDPVTEAATPPDATARLLFGYLAETRSAQFILIESAAMALTEEPSAETLQEVYEDYAADFQAPEYRSVTYMTVAPADFFGEVEVSEEEARARYEATRESFDQAEKRGLRQVVYDTREEAEAALAAVQGGKTLDEVAAESGTSVASIAPQSEAQLAGVLPALAAAAFALSEGERFGLAETLLGWHLFEVASVEAGETRSFEEVREQVIEQIRLERAGEAMSSVVSQINQEFASGATLDETAERLSLPLKQVAMLDRDGLDRAGREVRDIPSPAEFLNHVFNSDAGFDSLLTQLQDGSYFAYRVDSITPPTARPYDEVAPQVRSLWERLERDRLAKAEAQALAASVTAGTSTLDQIATERGLTLETANDLTRFDSDPAVVPAAGLAPALFESETGDAVTVPADGGTLLAVLTAVKAVTPEEAPDRFQNLLISYEQSLVSDMQQQFNAALRREYGVQIYDQVVNDALSAY